jgi:hypothetical protein
LFQASKFATKQSRWCLMNHCDLFCYRTLAKIAPVVFSCNDVAPRFKTCITSLCGTTMILGTGNMNLYQVRHRTVRKGGNIKYIYMYIHNYNIYIIIIVIIIIILITKKRSRIILSQKKGNLDWTWNSCSVKWQLSLNRHYMNRLLKTCVTQPESTHEQLLINGPCEKSRHLETWSTLFQNLPHCSPIWLHRCRIMGCTCNLFGMN